ncbi:MAG: hypothetical protein IKW28_05820 [Lachnospiraceae bacterium]|nr:hypothetical protein [Lachnospiraceae bacterium]
MKNNVKKTLLCGFLLSAFLLLLSDSSRCISYASQGLLLWFEKMIPTLFPFMVLSGFLVRSKLIEKVSFLLFPITAIFHITPVMSYALFMGFTCGFPMGAKVISDLWETKQITKKQGEFLLAFNNNIGPTYLLGYVLPFFSLNQPYHIAVFYLVPLGYGLFLRILPRYRGININTCPQYTVTEKHISGMASFYHALTGALEQINLLGGCMILFNCLLIYPLYLSEILLNIMKSHQLSNLIRGSLSCLTEIGGGLFLWKNSIGMENISIYFPLIFSFLTIGGLSCIVQTAFILEKTGLSIKKYLLHKALQSLLIFLLLTQITKMLQ